MESESANEHDADTMARFPRRDDGAGLTEALLNATSDAAFLMDPEGTILTLNEKLAARFDLPRAALIGKNTYALLPPHLAKRRRRNVETVITTRRPHVDEDQRGDRILRNTIYPLLDPDGRVVHLAIFSQDITDHRRAIEELEAANTRLRALWSITSLSDASVKTITDHVLMTITKMTGSDYGFYGFVNGDESVMTIHAWSGEAMAHCSMVEKPTDFPIDTAGLWAEAVRHRKPLIQNDYASPHPAKHGLPPGHVPLRNLLVVPFGAGGRVSSVAAVANRPRPYDDEDVTQLLSFLQSIQAVIDSKRTEEALALSERKFRSLVETTNDLVWQVDAEGRYTYVGPNCQSIIGFAPEELIGKTPFDLMAPAEARRVALQFQPHLEQRERIIALEDTMLHRDGHPVVFETNAVPVFDAEGAFAGYFGTCRDITDRKRAEEEREELRERLLQSQKMESIGRLAGGVAHDFNNMLGVILGHVELADGRLEGAHPIRASLGEVRAAAERSAELTRRLLTFARRQTVAPKVLDLNETLASMLRMLGRLIGEDVDLVWEPGAEPAPVRIDPVQVDQLLANLCVNARDAIGTAGGGRIAIRTGRVRVTAGEEASHGGAAPGEYVLLSVRDNGCGMDADTRANIFEPFYTTKEVGTGTGLGLAMVYGIVKQNEGHIRVKSTPGQGAEFTIYLPVRDGLPAHSPEQSAPAPTATGHETILLVEDEPAILKMTKTMLALGGYTVLDAATPTEALRLAREHAGEIHLLVTDVVMPEKNGRELALELRSIYPEIRCLFMSGYTSDVIAPRGVLEDGMNFIQKPFDSHELARKVRDTLEGPPGP